MKLTISWRFAALSTLVVAIIFVLFNAFVYFQFLNVTIQNEKQVILLNLDDEVRRIANQPLSQIVADIRQIVPDPHQMVRVLNEKGHVLTSTTQPASAPWTFGGLRLETSIGNGVMFYQYIDQRLLIASKHVPTPQGIVTVQWLENVESLDHSIAFVFTLLLTGSIGGLFLALIASYFLARYSLQPIRAMIATARAITPGDLSNRLDVPKRQDELTELGHTFNDMLDRISLAFRRERQFIADASHELRTPLSVLEGYVQLLSRWGWQDEMIRTEAVNAIEEEVKHLSAMASQLLSLAAVDNDLPSADEEIDLGEVAELVAARWVRLYPEYTWQIDIAHQAKTRILMQEVRIQQVMRALLDNARKYTPKGGTIMVSVTREGEFVHLRIRDSGVGIPTDDLPHVTERFYRADKARGRQHGGVGLGLAICKEIVESAFGHLYVQSEENVGTEVTVSFYGIDDEEQEASE